MGSSDSTLYPNHGYRILDILPDSPISETDARVMVDFICHEVSGQDDLTLSEKLKKFEGKELELVVYNFISQEKRIVTICPNQNWGGDSLLGCAIRFEDYSDSHKNVFYVADVYPNSPALKAGLVAKSDFIIGTSAGILKSLEDFGRLAKANLGKKIPLVIYRVKENEEGGPGEREILEIEIIPSENWGGKGILGCELLTGAKFIIPAEPTDIDLSHTQSQREELHQNVPKTSILEIEKKPDEVIEYEEFSHEEEPISSAENKQENLIEEIENSKNTPEKEPQYPIEEQKIECAKTVSIITEEEKVANQIQEQQPEVELNDQLQTMSENSILPEEISNKDQEQHTKMSSQISGRISEVSSKKEKKETPEKEKLIEEAKQNTQEHIQVVIHEEIRGTSQEEEKEVPEELHKEVQVEKVGPTAQKEDTKVASEEVKKISESSQEATSLEDQNISQHQTAQEGYTEEMKNSQPEGENNEEAEIIEERIEIVEQEVEEANNQTNLKEDNQSRHEIGLVNDSKKIAINSEEESNDSFKIDEPKRIKAETKLDHAVVEKEIGKNVDVMTPDSSSSTTHLSSKADSPHSQPRSRPRAIPLKECNPFLSTKQNEKEQQFIADLENKDKFLQEIKQKEESKTKVPPKMPVRTREAPHKAPQLPPKPIKTPFTSSASKQPEATKAPVKSLQKPALKSASKEEPKVEKDEDQPFIKKAATLKSMIRKKNQNNNYKI
ncbi:unnamed protein product [Moneuplotes crassus]|uniref:PDZ GRASP-type domain-containing protein n=1 Tax=Euplotes crassus TaxID=5936 RepID=A0AAD1U3R4_EUPCR|nr:unnamed protein product [Moneuplotes crassus]